jgi:hypothetical protein
MNRLLQYPLPRPTKPIPEVWLVDHKITNRDETRLGIVGLGRDTFPIPREVQAAYSEYWENMRRFHIRSEPTWTEKMEVLLALWLLYRRELEYVPFEPVQNHPATI